MPEKAKNIIIDFTMYVIGSVLFAMSVNCFTSPNNLAPGGLVGIGTMIHYLSGFPIGTAIVILNIPLFIIAYFKIGIKFIYKTIAATVISSAVIDIGEIYMPVYHGDMILTAIYGGILSGLGLSFVFIRGATTGGTDLAAGILIKRIRYISMGKFMMIVDFIIVSFAAIVYKNIDSPLYSAIVIYISSKVIDAVLYGISPGNGKLMYIISPDNQNIADKILTDLHRGVTALSARGAYSGRTGEVLMCAVGRHELHKTYDIIKKIDPHAFIIVGNAGEITGEGFKNIDDKDALV